MPRKREFEKIARKIFTTFMARGSRQGYERIPPLHQVVTEYGTSYPTIRKAIDYLAGQGKVIHTHAHAFFLVDPAKGLEAGDLKDASIASEKLYYQIREKILSGHYSSGVQLPKTDYFIMTCAVSPNTIGQALLRLQEDKLVFKRGKRWIVGNPDTVKDRQKEQNIEASYRSDTPVVLICARNFNRYYFLREYTHFRPFVENFIRELEVNSIQTEVCYGEKVQDMFHQISGLEGICHFARSLGRRFAGILVVGTETMFDAAFFDALLNLGKPIVWFDINDASVSGKYSACKKDRSFFVFRTNEKAATQRVVEYLHSLGHRRVGVPIFKNPYAIQKVSRRWIDIRLGLLKKYGAEMDPPLEIIDQFQGEPFFLAKEFSHFIATPTYLKKMPADIGRREYARQLYEKTPSMRYLLSECLVTATIGLNDQMAREHFIWSVWAGIEVPKRLSILSFDNHADAAGLGLTSIDFGYDHSGYQAAHHLLGSLPLHRRRGETLFSRPRLIVRHSTGPAPKEQVG